MNLLAASILLSTVLYLVDKNQQWSRFWKVAKWGSLTAVIGIAIMFGYGKYKTGTSNIPPLPPGYVLDQPSH